jgi:superfamily I DNA/RNA helicase
MNLEVIFGPPGTGKTTALSQLIAHYAATEGADSLLVTAYTRTAARELAGRALPVDEQHVGTLHSHCFHALGNPPIAETCLKEWNITFPVYAMAAQKSSWNADEPVYAWKRLGDDALHRVNVLRHQLIPVDAWPAGLRLFWKKWVQWKDDNGYCDFTDLLERARQLVPVAPGRPSTIIVDEAQDLSLLQWALLTQWGTHATRVIVAGDDEQCLYRWAGADFRPLLAGTQRRTLPQSYRVPRAIQARALRYAKRIRLRHAKTWQPRADEGAVRHGGEPWDAPDALLPRLLAWLEEPWGTTGSTVACLAPCAYMLDPLLAVLKARGIPFSNRWRRNNAAWNPLEPLGHTVGIVRQVLDFLKDPDRLWTWQELATWAPLVRNDGVMRSGAKRAITLKAKDTALCTEDDLKALFVPEALHGALQGSVEWLKSHATPAVTKTLAYPLRVYARYGEAGLTAEPHLTVGTVHSLKGAEADTVLFWQDLSRTQQLTLCQGGAGADDIYRMLYVAATRARHVLYVLGTSYA